MTQLEKTVKSLLEVNLQCKENQRAIILTDDAAFLNASLEVADRAALATKFSAVAVELGLDAKTSFYRSPGRPGCEPPLDIWNSCYPNGFVEHVRELGILERMLQKQTVDIDKEREINAWLKSNKRRIDVLVVLSKFSITHTRFAGLLSKHGNVKVATMPGVEPAMFNGVLDANWVEVKRRSVAVSGLLSKAQSATISSPGGHTLKMSLAGREGIADTGFISPGEIGNLPGGEAFIAPVEGSVHGSIAVGPRHSPTDWVLEFSNGRLSDIEGNPPFERQLREQIAAQPASAVVAELGVGTNESARSTEITLEAEKILGTVHVAVGDNSGFGGTNRVDFHKDYVSFEPTLILERSDGTKIVVVKDGKFLV